MSRTPAIGALLLVLLAMLGLTAGAGRLRKNVVDLLRDGSEGEPARCEIDGDSRASRILPPGQQLVLETRVPTAATLRFSLGTTDGSPPPAWHLTIEAPNDGDRVLAEDDAVPKYAWLDRAIDLTGWSGREVRIRAVAGPRRAPLSSHICWAMPRFSTRHRGDGLVLVVLVDTVRADHLRLYGYERRTSPALEALAADGVAFDDFAADVSWTRASVSTLFTGQSSLVHGVLNRDAHLGPSWPTMAERLRAAGAHTVALSTNPNVLPFWGLARGFDRFVDVGAAEWTANTDAARVLAAARAAAADAADEWTFLYVHINDAHAPYDPPAADAAAVLGGYDPALPGRVLSAHASPAELQGAIDRYDGEIAHLDRELGNFFAYLKEHDQYRSSLIAVVGDHGEEFMDHGGIYHGHTLYREQLRTPLVVKLPDLVAAGTRRTDAATMRDVLPTIEAVLGISTPSSGRVLLDAAGREGSGSSLPRFAVTDMDDATVYAVEDESSTLIRQMRPTARTLFFDRRSDPRQERDLAAEPPPTMARLEALLESRLLSQRAGWHLRLCGAFTPMHVTLAVESATPLTRVEPLGLEPQDVLVTADSGHGLRLESELAPQVRQEELFGKLVPRRVVDDDEVMLESEGPLSLALQGPAMPIRIGAAAAVTGPDNPIDRRAAAAPATYAPKCDGHPALFVWYAGSDTHPAIDESLERRLRALGYLH